MMQSQVYFNKPYILQKQSQKIQASPNGSTLFFAHSSSVTMWDVQTGGLIYTFNTQSARVNDIGVSISGDHIACGLSNGSVTFWNIRTKRGRDFGDGELPVVAICWLSPQKLAVATQNTLYIRDIAAGKTMDSLSIPDHVWGMLYSGEGMNFWLELRGQALRQTRTVLS
jgi:WD40 repeat protein